MYGTKISISKFTKACANSIKFTTSSATTFFFLSITQNLSNFSCYINTSKTTTMRK